MDDNGHRLTGGGLLPYDDNGVWAISEVTGSRENKADVGGKYRFEDIDIFGCIAREWNEETYFTAEMRKRDLEYLTTFPRTSRVYVNDHQRNPTYVAYLVHVDDLQAVCNTVLDPTRFIRARRKAIEMNPDVPQDYYSSVRLEYNTFDDISDVIETKPSVNLSIGYRLRRILMHGALKSRIGRPTLRDWHRKTSPPRGPTSPPRRLVKIDELTADFASTNITLEVKN